MSRALKWMLVVVLCGAAGIALGEGPPEAGLLDAQRAFDEATRLREEGRYADAIPKAEKALTLREAVLGGTHPEVADCLHLLGALHSAQQDAARAEPLFQRALAIQEAALGQHHPQVARSLNSLANLYCDQGRFAQAEPLYERALAIGEASFGPHHPNVASSLHNLALLYYEQGLYTRAEPLYQRALTIREATLGKHHPQVAHSLDGLGALYVQQGLYTRAQPLHERALAILEAALGKNDPDLAGSLNDLANLYIQQGLYARAEPLHLRAIAIREATLGKHHPQLAQSLNNLAILYVEQGLYARAEPLYQRALAIREAALGKHHPEVFGSLTNLASLHAYQGQYARAEPLAQRALAISEASLGEHHPRLAGALTNLASIYSYQGLYTQAESLHQRALAIREGALGKHHPHVAQSLGHIANIYALQGLYARAVPLYERVLAIEEATFGKHHPYLAHSLSSLAQVHLAQGRLNDAVPLLTQAFVISEQRLRQEALDFSEARLTSFLQFLSADEELIYSMLRAHPSDAHVRRLAFTTVLLRKGRSVEEIADTTRTIHRGLAQQDRDTFERLRGLRTLLAQLSLDGLGSLSAADYQQRLSALADEGDALEADLARRSAPLRALTTLPAPTEVVDRVATALPPDGALVEFVVYADRPLIPEIRTPQSRQSSRLRYLALVLFPDSSIRVLDLGPAGDIDLAASDLRKALGRRDSAYERPAQALYALAFQPLLPLLGDARRLFLAPDGQLALAPFDALHDGQRFLVDAFDFTYLTSGKELLPRDPSPRTTSSVVVLSDPHFDAPPATSSVPRADDPGGQRSPALERFFSTLRTGSFRRSWSPLPGTRREAETIQRLLPQAQLFLGPDATKQRLLQLPVPGVLHIATHGFFLGDASAPSASRGLGYVGGMGGGPAQLSPDPLLRSGLVLSGARATSAFGASGPASASAEASLVTALELAGLDLWGTQLVVLSACDTGRGDVRLGQGVYGLRRAFVVAGAETVVMSLWKVSDDSTHLLMEDYYRHLLAGKGRAQALREAMRTLRETRPHPYHWAPFITVGRDGPLREIAPTPQVQTMSTPLPRRASPEPR